MMKKNKILYCLLVFFSFHLFLQCGFGNIKLSQIDKKNENRIIKRHINKVNGNIVVTVAFYFEEYSDKDLVRFCSSIFSSEKRRTTRIFVFSGREYDQGFPQVHDINSALMPSKAIAFYKEKSNFFTINFFNKGNKKKQIKIKLE